MRDRTLIILAVLFLTLSIGSGVNKSLEAGNRTMGKPMAPDLKQLYNRNIPYIVNQVTEFNESGQQRARQVVFEKYPAIMGSINRSTTSFSGEIKTQTEVWRGKFQKAYSMVKNKMQDKKNMVVR